MDHFIISCCICCFYFDCDTGSISPSIFYLYMIIVGLVEMK